MSGPCGSFLELDLMSCYWLAPGSAASSPRNGQLVAAMPALPLSLSFVKSRTIKRWELGYKTPHSKPNALDVAKEGMWTLEIRDRRPGCPC